MSIAGFLAFAAGAAHAQTLPPVGLRLEGMSYVLAEGGEVQLTVEAHRAEVAPGAGRIALRGVRARVVSAPEGSGTGGLELVCERGELDLANGEFVARGKVAGRTPSGRTLRTEQLRYVHARGLISGDAPVAMSDDSGDYRGGGFRYWVREDRFRLSGGARIVQGD